MRSTRAAAGRAALLAAALVAGTWALAAPASAHVTVHADQTTAGGTDVEIAFRVPNEEDTATTTKLVVQLPTDHPLLGVLVRPHAGWSSAVQQVKLNPPVQTDDGEVTQAVSVITWTATNPAAGIPVGGYDDFAIIVGKLPDRVTALTFKAIQTYSDGKELPWIDQAAPGGPEPEHPAPVLTLTAGATDQPTPQPAATASSPAPTQPTTPANTANSASDTTARTLGITGIVLAVLLGIGGYLLGRRATTHTPSATS
jgi:uncharacterized protein YcnI